MRKLGVRDRKLLRKARRHTRICAGCFGMWVWVRGKKDFVLNREALEKLLLAPRDERPFERHKGTWYHKDCWQMLLDIKGMPW